nr:helix-turn-helix domain-containing protein [uncultured Carboxylicivirga sp.]
MHLKRSNILSCEFQDFDSNPNEIFIRSIDEIKERAGKMLHVPKRFNFYKIVYVTKGEGWHKVDMHNHYLTSETILPIGINTYQCFSDVASLEGFVIHFTHNFFAKERENYNYLSNYNIFLNPSIINCNKELSFVLHQLRSIYEAEHSIEKYDQIINYLRVLLLSISINKQANDLSTASPQSELYQRFQSVLDKHINYSTKVVDICDHLQINSRKLNTALKSITGKGVKEVIDERLILEIKRLLLYSDLSVKEIAFKLGFDEAANLTNFFKRHTNQSPVKFRGVCKKSETYNI